VIRYQSFMNSKLPGYDLTSTHNDDFDFVTHDLFHQPTLDENDIADQLVIEPFPEGASSCR
jgi:hypothetical protein